MQTYNKFYNKLCSYENLLSAFKKARKGKSSMAYVKEFEKNLKINLKILQFELINKTYQPKKLKLFIIHDPKTRKICKSNFRDRIIHHAIVNILEPIYEKIFIYDSYASRKNKGQHKALERFHELKRKVSLNGKKLKGIKDNNYICGYCLKADIKKYFDNVDHETLINILRKKIKDENVIWLIKQILKNNLNKIKDKSMPLGNYTSQFFANVYLNGLDYFVKHKLKVKYYIRYVDDFIILHNQKEILEYYKQEINEFIKSNLKLELHEDKSKIIPLHEGIKFLGFRSFYYYRLLKKSNINQIKRNLIAWNEMYETCKISEEKFKVKIESWKAHASHGNNHNLTKKLKINKYF